MTITRLFIISITLFLCMFLLAFSKCGSVELVDGESMFYVVILSFISISLLLSANNISRPLIIVTVLYIIQMYLFGTFKYFILSLYGTDHWNYLGFIKVAGKNEINMMLRYACFGTFLIGGGIYFGTRLGKRVKNNVLKNLQNEEIHLSSTGILIIYIFMMIASLWYSSQFGYGAMSGQEAVAIYKLYGVADVYVVITIATIVAVFKWGKLTNRDKIIFIFIIVSSLFVKVAFGSRGGLLFMLQYLIYFLCVFKGDFVVRKKMIVLATALLALFIFIYPISKGIKELYIYKGKDIDTFNLVKVFQNIYFQDLFEQVIENKSYYFIDIMSRVGDNIAQLRIISDGQLNPIEEHINLINTFKRALNDMVPGDIFTDVMPTQHLYGYLYEGKIPEHGYSGEVYSLFAVYYQLFGYAGSLIAVFVSCGILGLLWKKLLISNIRLKPIYLGFSILTFDIFLNNRLMESWISVSVFLVILQLMFTFAMIFLATKLWDVFAIHSKIAIQPHREEG